ncbi:hypothetical protein [Variovorax sp. PCZ-1]|uniref:hypothetical protein n=1 Tax=Variovorax sp. PCZ-1 TaxID=2835533 RepID=UPI001BCF4EA4|nr:hypothetical protein [Variovorax sp. PCZ-1]MBS7806368.1 hypothetical protein [Variovorax sp. PCZ-1]
MRRIFFSLLIVLTAFRGLVGDAMAYEMTSGMLHKTQNAIESIAASADSMPANSHFPHEKAASMPCHEAVNDTSADASSHACNTCQVCHLSASLPSAFMSLNAQPLRDVQAAWESTWHSAEQQHIRKPPIL